MITQPNMFFFSFFPRRHVFDARAGSVTGKQGQVLRALFCWALTAGCRQATPGEGQTLQHFTLRRSSFTPGGEKGLFVFVFLYIYIYVFLSSFFFAV